jgi:hypothetical protein
MTSASNIVTDIAVSIENALAAGKRVTVKDLSASYGIKVAVLRSMLIAHYGNRIQFKRGRTGGIALTSV